MPARHPPRHHPFHCWASFLPPMGPGACLSLRRGSERLYPGIYSTLRCLGGYTRVYTTGCTMVGGVYHRVYIEEGVYHRVYIGWVYPGIYASPTMVGSVASLYASLLHLPGYTPGIPPSCTLPGTLQHCGRRAGRRCPGLKMGITLG